MALLGAVAIAAAAVLTHQWRNHRQERWRHEFEAAQKPQLELAKLRTELNQRLDGIESTQRRAEFKKLG